MHRLIAVVDGKALDLTDLDDAQANTLLDLAAGVSLAAPTIEETVNHDRARGRWLKGGRHVEEDELPDGWDLPNDRRIPRPGGRENPHKPAKGKTPEVRAKWRLQSSTPQT